MKTKSETQLRQSLEVLVEAATSPEERRLMIMLYWTVFSLREIRELLKEKVKPEGDKRAGSHGTGQ
jgi:hypothetical protein